MLDARALYPECSLADLYDPLTMPPELVTAHRKLDAAVEKAYGRSFADDAERVAFLFEKYRKLTENSIREVDRLATSREMALLSPYFR